MLDVDLLGTGGMLPLPGRFLSSLMVRCRGKAILIDCGEGTQVAIRVAGLGFKQIGVIAFTHFHADHISGLPGLLLMIANSGRTEPLVIIGPQGVQQVVDSLCVIAPQLPYPIEYRELEANGTVWVDGPLALSAQAVEHGVPCYAYRIDLARQARFDVEKAKALNIPVQLWSALQNGAEAVVDGRTVMPDAVAGPPRKGLRLCYATDMRPGEDLLEFARGADLFVCEGMHGDPGALAQAMKHGHCLFTEAAEMAAQAQVHTLWLTHFSPAMPDPEAWLLLAKAIFPNSCVRQTQCTLRFEDV